MKNKHHHGEQDPIKDPGNRLTAALFAVVVVSYGAAFLWANWG